MEIMLQHHDSRMPATVRTTTAAATARTPATHWLRQEHGHHLHSKANNSSCNTDASKTLDKGKNMDTSN
jgi:hypothetical protein